MSGFNRPEGGWTFAYAGINTVDSADQMQPDEYPLAENVRSLPDHHVETRPGYDNFFTVPDVITLTCPTNSGTVDVPYSSSIGVTGGQAPFTYSISSGALPDGLSLDPDTGIISGTPTTDDTFNFTIHVTDSSGQSASAPCYITVSPPAICGLTAELPFELVGGVLVKPSATIDKSYENMGVWIDTADYPGVTTAEVTLGGRIRTNAGGTFFGEWQIVDEDGNVYADITPPSSLADSYVTFPDPAPQFALRSGNHHYFLKVLHGAIFGQATIETATIKLLLNDTIGWKIQIPMISGLDWANTVGVSGTQNASNVASFLIQVYKGDLTTSYFTAPAGHPSYEPGTGGEFGYQTFLKDESKWPTDVTWELEVWGMIESRVGSDTLYVGLVNVDDGTLVTGSEIAITASSLPTRYTASFANNAANFTTGKKFRIRMRYDTADNAESFDLHRVNLYAIQPASGAPDGGVAQIQFPMGYYTATIFHSPYDYLVNGTNLYTDTRFDLGKTTFSFIGSYFGDLSGMHVVLVDYGTNPTFGISSTPSGTIIATFDLPHNNAFDVWQVAFDNSLLVPGHYYTVRGEDLCGATLGMGQWVAETVC